ncbi:MAG: transposase [Acidimicrobiia bacterium]
MLEATAHRFLVGRSLLFLRVSVGAVFVYFGALKLFPGRSPAEDLVMKTVEILTFDIISGRTAVLLTGLVECAVGLLLVTGLLLRLAAYALGLQLLGILAPLVLLPGRLFDGVEPTLEGQYVVKDFILLAGALVLICAAKGGRLVCGPDTAQPTQNSGTSAGFLAEEKLRIVLDAISRERSDSEVASEHGITPEEFRRWHQELLDGALARMSAPVGRSWV